MSGRTGWRGCWWGGVWAGVRWWRCRGRVRATWGGLCWRCGGAGAGRRALASTSVNFDVSVFEVFTSLCHGGSIEVVRDVLALGERSGWGGQIVSTVPSAFAELAEQLAQSSTAIDTLVFAGEALPVSLVRR